jgi:diguanylate cyclase (GGDEF)-like protein
LLVADIDHYRELEATFGEEYAEDVLKTVFDLARSNLREGELVTHPGGDELVALLHATAPVARDVAERLCAAVRGHVFSDTSDGRAPQVTISVGVATAPEQGTSYAALHAAADAARVRIKAHGRDGAAVAPLAGHEPAPRQLDIDRFAGRVEELRTLTRYLVDATRGRPRAVAIVGETGSGTATLLRQLEPQLRLRGGSLVVGRCRNQRVREPYGVWAALITALARLPEAPRRAWRELHELVPELGGGKHSPETRSGSKYRLLDEVAEYLRLSAQQRPLLIVLDEMQWADAASWDVLEHVIQQLDNDRVLLCFTTRAESTYAEAAERRQPLTRSAVYRELPLTRLTRDQVKRWLEGAMHDQEIGREFLAFVYRHTEGNPFFVAQLLRTLLEEGALWQRDGQWGWSPVSELRLPIGLTALIARRLARLSSSTQAVLSTAAVIGDEFDVARVVAAGAGSEGAVQLALSEGLSAGILKPTYERGGRGYAFAHSLMAEALAESLSPDRRRPLHLRVAEALVARRSARAAEVAQHFDAAGAAVPAYQYALLAAEHADRVYAHAAAQEFLRVAARNATTPGDLAEVRVRLAGLAELMTRYDEAEELCDLAIEWYEGQGDAHRALTLRSMRERARRELGQPARVSLDALLVLHEEAKRLGLEKERVEILLMVSQTHGRLGDPRQSESLAGECVRMAEMIGDQPLLAQALNRLALTVERDDPERAGEHYRRALPIFEDIGDVRGQARCHINLGNLAGWRSDWDAARRSYATAISLARAAAMPDQWGIAATNLAVVAHRGGDFDRARELLGEALALVAAVKNSELQLYALYNMAHIEWETQQWESGAELYEATASLAQRIGADDVEIGATAAVGLCRAAARDLDAARAANATVEERIRRRSDWFQGREFVEALAVTILVADGQIPEAIVRFEGALRTAEASDLYTAGWLTAVCGRSLFRHVPEVVRPLIELYSDSLREHGYTDISKQLTDLLTG